MKAIVYFNYGSPDVLKCEELEKPAPADGEVLIRVRAAATNPLDWHYMRGTPYEIRLFIGMGKPKVTRLGVDVAGEVEAVGRSVTGFKPGDAVFGSCRGAFAEYVCASAGSIVLKPEAVSYEQAASVPVPAYTALQALRDKAHMRAGQSVLVNGAAGGVGTFAVQIAKAYGCGVTGVCSTRNVELVRSLGADRVVDYAQEDFTRGGQRYDIIVDNIGNHSLAELRRVLAPEGTLVGVGAKVGRWMIGLVAQGMKTAALSALGRQKLLGILARPNQPDLEVMCELMAAGKVRPVIDRSYPLHETAEAIRYLETGHVRGKVVIAI